MSRTISIRICVGLFLCLLAVSRAWSQSAGFSGTVLDPSGKSIAGADVTLTNEENGAARSAVTESDGKFVFAQLAPGKYKLEVSAAGFKTSVRPHLELLVGTTSSLDVRLELGGKNETMVVEARVIPLNTTDASIGTPISGTQLSALPVLDMNPAGLLGLQTGVAYIPSAPDKPSGYGGVSSQDGRSGAVNGARSDQNNVTLDGIDVNDSQNGYAFTSVLRTPTEALGEFRTSTTGYDADSGGRSSAAQVQLVTKSGTNSLHGSAYYSHRNEAFNANDFFLNREGITEPKFRHHLYGGSFGGPIIKDRVFLFGDYERLKESLFSSATRNVPSVAFKDGVFYYQCRNFDASSDLPQYAGNPACAPPIGGFVTGFSGTTSYGMDANQRPCRQTDPGCGPIPQGFYALSPSEISALDPQSTDPAWTGPVGPNPAVMAYDQQLPDPNDSGSFDQLNILGYRFGAPTNNLFNTAVIRADVNLDRAGKHILFWRGNLMHDTINDAPSFPGQAPKHTSLNNNKGFAVGYTAVLTNALVNNFHYGLTRISEKNSGLRNSEFVTQRFIDDLAGFYDSNATIPYNNTDGRILPQHHFRDDVSWTKGVHQFSFGGEFRRTRNATFSNANSFPIFVVNPSWTPSGGAILEPGNSACEQAGCFTVPLNGGGSDSFHDGLTELLGPISDITALYNFDKTGATTPEGDPVSRRFGVNEYELYVQDKWRLKPSFTLTLGLRYYIGSPPWETNGNQVAPNPSFGDWFDCRQKAMSQALPTDQTCGLITTDLAGPANHRPGYYDYDFKNLSPRIAFAWSPQFKEGLFHSIFGQGKTSIRGGYSMVYDRIGNGLATSFDSIGSFGLSTSIESFFGGCGIGHEGTQSNGPCLRFSGNSDTAAAKSPSNMCGAPAVPCLTPSPGGGFPATPPTGLLTVSNGLDSRIKTPYSHTIDLSVGRELPGNMTLEVAYVGRLAHRLTLLRDLAMPADVKDPKSGVTAFQAAKLLEGYAEQNANAPAQGLATITPGAVSSFWDNIFPAFGPTGINGGCLLFNTFSIGTNADGSPVAPDSLPCGYSPTQVAYDYMIGYHGTAGGPGFGTSTFWQDTDYFASPAYPTCSSGTDIPQIDTNGDGIPDVGDGFLDCPSMFFPSQYVNLNTWTTSGYSFYHALQVTLRKNMSHGLSFVLNYTFSHSLDTSSSPERQDIYGGQSLTGGYSGVTINSWNIRQEYANSDFDIRHQFNGYWVADLPFGKGKWLGGHTSNWLDHIIGGWTLSGIVHLNSGPPANVVNGRTWPTSWDLQGNATCAPQGSYIVGLAEGPCPGTQNVKNATHGSGQGVPNIFSNPDSSIGFFRFTATGDRGQRNVLRADRYFSTDVGLAKTIKLGERVGLVFHWDVFNLTNSAYFDASGVSLSPSRSGTFGDYTQMLGRPRQMQGSLKLVF